VAVEVGLCLSAFADWRWEDALAQTRDLGFSLVDLPTDSVFALTEPLRDGRRPQAKELLDGYGLRVGCVSNSRDCQLLLGPHGPHTDGVLRGDTEAKRHHARRHALAAIDFAEQLGAPLVRLFLGCPDFAAWLRWPGSEVSWADNVAAFVEVAADLAAVARRADVTLCVEPHVKQVPFDLPSVAACVSGVEATGARLAVCFDPANIAALHDDAVAFLAALAGEGITPACVHAKDVELAGSSVAPSGAGWVSYGPQPAIRFRSVPWGRLDWPALLTQLHEVGFAGPVLIEHEDVLVERCAGIAATKRYLDAMLAGSGLAEAGPGRAWW
jgi:sugar phosphate isomerase/epimerase